MSVDNSYFLSPGSLIFCPLIGLLATKGTQDETLRALGTHFGHLADLGVFELTLGVLGIAWGSS